MGAVEPVSRDIHTPKTPTLLIIIKKHTKTTILYIEALQCCDTFVRFFGSLRASLTLDDLFYESLEIDDIDESTDDVTEVNDCTDVIERTDDLDEFDDGGCDVRDTRDERDVTLEFDDVDGFMRTVSMT